MAFAAEAVTVSSFSPAHTQGVLRGAFVSVLFVFGVISQNLQLLPIGSEYQPWLYCSVVPFAIITAWVRDAAISRQRLLGGALFAMALTLLLVLASTQASTIPIKDAVRVLGLPLVAISTWLYLRDVNLTAIRLLIFLHAGILMLAVLSPEAAAAVSGAFGTRGQGYYLGWNSYFYSEPSYAALTFLFLAFFLARHGPIAALDSLALVALLASTFSVTGAFGAAMVAGTFVWQRSRLLFTGGCAVAVLCVLSITMIPADTSVRTLQRLVILAEAVEGLKGMSAESIAFVLNAAEPSGMWRVASNLYGMSCANENPLGLGNTDVYAAITRSECSNALASLLQQNETFRLLGRGASAQSILGNLSVFAGIPGLIMGCVLLAIQLSAFRLRFVMAALPLSAAFLLFFVIWQSAWAAPSASVLLAATYIRRRGREPPTPASVSHV